MYNSNLLLQLILSVIDGDGVIVSVKSMNQSLKEYELSRSVSTLMEKFCLVLHVA